MVGLERRNIGAGQSNGNRVAGHYCNTVHVWRFQAFRHYKTYVMRCNNFTVEEAR